MSSGLAKHSKLICRSIENANPFLSVYFSPKIPGQAQYDNFEMGQIDVNIYRQELAGQIK
jgi:hypothetical protein